ncbi:hypothetical protein AX17_002484 [Amanita inopinata Kibby_2008]|nr:hypothetical protein AX17_002484 [Amanita inopinata Kibby_2008]
MALAAFATGVAYGVRSWIIKDLDKLATLDSLVICWLALQTAVDLLIAGVLSFALYRSRTKIRRTNKVVYRLIRTAIQTGVFSTIFAMGYLVAFLVSPEANFDMLFGFPFGCVYTLTFMDNLIIREGLKEMLSGPVDLNLSNFIWGTQQPRDTLNEIELAPQREPQECSSDDLPMDSYGRKSRELTD